MLRPAYGLRGHKTSAPCEESRAELWTWGPRIGLEQLPQANRELQAQPGRGFVQVPAEQLPQPVQAIKHRVAVELQLRGRVLDGAAREMHLQRFHELLAVARCRVEQHAQGLAHEALGQGRVL